MATLSEARQKYRSVFGLDPAPSFTAEELMRAVEKSSDLEFMRQLYEKEFGIDLSGEEWAGDERDAGFLQRAIRANNELQDARADYAEVGGLPEDFDWSTDERTTGQLRRGISELTGGPDDLSPYDDTADEETSKEGVGVDDGDPDTPDLTILAGNRMNWYFDRSAGKWYVGYGLPNSNRELLFEAEPDQMDAIFGEGTRPAYDEIPFSTLSREDGKTFAGNIAEMEGTGRFEDEYEKVISLALDEGSLPSWMEGSDKALDALFVAQSENKSNEWLMEQWAKLPEFQARFPNIDKMQKEGNLNLQEAVTNFLQYEASLKQTAAAFGQDTESISPDIVGGLIDGGYSVKAAQDVFKAYDRMDENAEAMTAFNQILEANGMDPISDLQGMFDFVQGNAPDEYYDLYEASSLQEAATAAGLGDVFEAEDAIDAALRGEHTLDTAHQSMQQAAKLLLRLRNEVDAGTFGLDQDELIDLSLGQAPSSGRSQAEIQEAINRATLTARASLKGRAKPFTGFTESGTPQKRSLSNLRQQS